MRPRDPEKTRAEVANMRSLMQRERPGQRVWDLKLVAGGFVDIEFIAQALQITAGAGQILSSNTGVALTKLAEAGAIDPQIAARLHAAWRLYSDLNQMLRICAEGAFEISAAPLPLRQRLAAIVGVSDEAGIEAKLGEVQEAVREDFVGVIGWPAAS